MTTFLKKLAAVFLACLALQAAAQDYPSKPIRLIVPYPPGGAVDIYARLIAQKLNETRHWTVVVDNRAGAGGNIGMEQASKAAPDGYTLVIGQSSNLAIGPALYEKLPFDPLKDLAPIALIAEAPVVMVVPTGSRFKTFGDLIAAAKAKPGSVSIASPGNGTSAHLFIELLSQTAGVKFTHVPYKGTVQAMADLMGGQVDSFLATIAANNQFIKGGKVRALATASNERLAQLPHVPTIGESGYRGLTAGSWWGLLAPAGTPPAILDRLNAEINTVLKYPDVREKITADGANVLSGTAAEFSAAMKSEYLKWAKVVRAANLKIE